jgi:hypothetical protein
LELKIEAFFKGRKKLQRQQAMIIKPEKRLLFFLLLSLSLVFEGLPLPLFLIFCGPGLSYSLAVYLFSQLIFYFLMKISDAVCFLSFFMI